MINITDIRINLVKGDEKLKAYATIIINDSFLISDLRVIESDDGFFVAMPSRRKRDGSFKDIAYPLNNDLRIDIEKQVLVAFEKTSGSKAISNLENIDGVIRPDLLSAEEFGLTRKPDNSSK
ncbi:MAG: SpoVG family protein [Holophagaceae bacterium]|jgi:stage V sporulation protein G